MASTAAREHPESRVLLLAGRERRFARRRVHRKLGVRQPSKGFKDLGEKTGGKYFLVGDEKSALLPKQNDLTPVFQAIEEDLKSQYLLGFYISEVANDNRRHEFSVTLKPEGVEYLVGRFGYSRKQRFYVHRPPGSTKPPN